MYQIPNVAIVMARCCQTKQYYGIRFEERSQGHWVGDWAFAIKETMGKKEGYDRVEVKGIIELAEGYPGCPHCENMSIVQCSCQKVGCWDGVSLYFTCPYCGDTGSIDGVIGGFEGGMHY